MELLETLQEQYDSEDAEEESHSSGDDEVPVTDYTQTCKAEDCTFSRSEYAAINNLEFTADLMWWTQHHQNEDDNVEESPPVDMNQCTKKEEEVLDFMCSEARVLPKEMTWRDLVANPTVIYHNAHLPSKIFPQFYLGTVENASDKALLGGLGIQLIVNLCAETVSVCYECIEDQSSTWLSDQQFFQKIGSLSSSTSCILRVNIPALDRPSYPIQSHFPLCNRVLHVAWYQRGLTVLVHCIAGASRSPAITTAYLMWEFRVGYDAVRRLVSSRRSIAHPNGGFVLRLLEYELSGCCAPIIEEQ
jgi:protein-tyrosine phosphatase